MTPIEKLVTAPENTSLHDCNNIIWDNKINTLPLVDAEGNLVYIVFRKDYDSHKKNANELLDANKSYVVGAGINTRDYAERVPALVEAGVDVLCIDSSEGYSEWQSRTIGWIREHYGDTVKVGAGNVVDRRGLPLPGQGRRGLCQDRHRRRLHLHHPRDQGHRPRPGHGCHRGLPRPATSTSRRPASMCPSAPTAASSTIITSRWLWPWARTSSCWAATLPASTRAPRTRSASTASYMKEYWGEGSNRARNWQRYDLGGSTKLSFEEGVDSYVPYAGPLADGVQTTLYKVKSTMCNCGALSIPELQQKAKLTVVSSTSIVEGGSHDVMLKNATPNIING